MARNIIHLHIPSFPIAVARVCHPELRGRPVALASRDSERARLLAVSPEARKEGVFKGMALSTAVKRCPGLIFLPPGTRLTQKACRAVEKIVKRYTPVWEVCRPGHVYLDVTGTERLWGKAKNTGYRLTREIRAGLCLSGTAGVAANKMVSSIASRMPSSSGVRDVAPGGESLFVAPLKVGVLPGVGRFCRKGLLEELNISRVRDLAALDMGALKLIFGHRAHVIHQRALGIDPTPVYPGSAEPVIVEEMTLLRDENDDRNLLPVLYILTERCSFRLRERGLIPRKAGLLIRYSDQVEARCRLRLSPAGSPASDFYGPLKESFFKLWNRRVRLRFIRLWFRDFSAPDRQLTLFPTPSRLEEKQSVVLRALDRIREKYGEEAIRRGICCRG